ncbi:hypothetical protein PoB_007600600 [Plakobranchus ocellatus]|uniref:Uncharacterized protein n=1 Tax=Plakobranchus ocellatus TaxID=259542 RepID=A0AAV4E086_9GAST|nr:hypothetical protein PoB_007600600 [Plakobranchus ocellatus]
MGTVVQWNIRGLRSNFEELKLLLNLSQLLLWPCRSAGLVRGLCHPGVPLPQCGSPKGRLPSSSEMETVFYEIFLNTCLHAAVATINLEKTLTVCSLYLPSNTPVSKLSLAELFE